MHPPAKTLSTSIYLIPFHSVSKFQEGNRRDKLLPCQRRWLVDVVYKVFRLIPFLWREKVFQELIKLLSSCCFAWRPRYVSCQLLPLYSYKNPLVNHQNFPLQNTDNLSLKDGKIWHTRFLRSSRTGDSSQKNRQNIPFFSQQKTIMENAMTR